MYKSWENMHPIYANMYLMCAQHFIRRTNFCEKIRKIRQQRCWAPDLKAGETKTISERGSKKTTRKSKYVTSSNKISSNNLNGGGGGGAFSLKKVFQKQFICLEFVRQLYKKKWKMKLRKLTNNQDRKKRIGSLDSRFPHSSYYLNTQFILFN